MAYQRGVVLAQAWLQGRASMAETMEFARLVHIPSSCCDPNVNVCQIIGLKVGLTWEKAFAKLMLPQPSAAHRARSHEKYVFIPLLI